MIVGVGIWLVGSGLVAALALRFTSTPGLRVWSFLVFVALMLPLGFLIVRPFHGVAGLGRLGFIIGVFIAPAVVAWLVLRVAVAVFRQLRGNSRGGPRSQNT